MMGPSKKTGLRDPGSTGHFSIAVEGIPVGKNRIVIPAPG